MGHTICASWSPRGVGFRRGPHLTPHIHFPAALRRCTPTPISSSLDPNLVGYDPGVVVDLNVDALVFGDAAHDRRM